MKVDISAIESTMKAIDDYRNEYQNIITREHLVVEQMGRTWKGDDYEEFVKAWKKQTKANKSPEKLFKEELDEYYNYLKKAKELYSDMQKNLKARAKSLKTG